MDFYDILFAKSQNKGGGGGGGGNPHDSVVFYDYDGSIVASYSKAEFTAMPESPSHEGLVAQGWNWTKAEIDDYLNDCPEATVNVGQMYITDDGKTRLYVHFEKGRTSPYLGLGVDGTVEVDWGDGSSTDTLTGTSLTTTFHVHHIYQPGDYVIKLTPTSGNFSIFGTSDTSHILKKDASTGGYISRVYANALKKVEFGLNVSIGDFAFNYCYSLLSATIPSNITSIGSSAFASCSSLLSATIPSSVTSIGEFAFSYCQALTSVAIPNSATSIGSNTFYYCYSLASATIPSKVTSISASTFSNCNSLVSVAIPSSVTSIGNYAFSSCYSLASVAMPSDVTSIGKSVVSSCYSLVLVTVLSKATSIGDSAFSNCYGVAEYHFLSTTPPTLGTNVFRYIPYDCIIYVPMASVEAYKTANNWSTYASQIQGE